jgi:hypothetical protein
VTHTGKWARQNPARADAGGEEGESVGLSVASTDLAKEATHIFVPAADEKLAADIACGTPLNLWIDVVATLGKG